MSIKVVIHGAAGRMGQRLVALTIEDERLELVGAVEYSGSPRQGQDAGIVAQKPAVGILITDKFDVLAEADVVVDFSLPPALAGLVAACREHKTALVCGTTGLEEEQKALLAEAAQDIPLLYGPNMSIGVNLMFKVAQFMASLVNEDFDIEIFEKHHRFKKDAPSGTALRLAELVAEARSLNLAEVGRYSREGDLPIRPTNEIGVQSMRGGDIVGEHTLYFATPGERLELVHRATSRDIFVRGALQAARWLASKTPGKVYDMYDLLEDNG
jgi:4-hydroxy-tetrahydrodipicolinate reductase